jgi:hypothetical protein
MADIASNLSDKSNFTSDNQEMKTQVIAEMEVGVGSKL